jgi:vitamin B12 transporter
MSNGVRWIAAVAGTVAWGWALAAEPPTVEKTAERPSEAETPAPAVAVTGETIVVTATRLALPADEVASSVTVVDSGQMARRQDVRVSDALRQVPGLDIVRSGGVGGTVSTYVRGAGSERVLVLVDGVEANDPAGPARECDLAHLPLLGADRIEVLRGPQSTLYGSDAMAGVIHVVSRRGEGPLQGSVLAEGGSFGAFRASAEARGAQGKVDYALGLSREHTEGISSASEDNGNTEKDGYENTSFAGRFGWTPTEAVSLDVLFRSTAAETEYDDFDYVTGLPVDADNRGETESYRFRSEGRLALFEEIWEQKLGVSLAYQSRDDTTAAADSSFVGNLRKVDWQHDLRLAGWDTLTAGLEYEQETAESVYEGEALTERFGEEAADTAAGFLQNHLRAGPVRLTAGLRLDRHSEAGSEWTYRVAPMWVIERTGTRLKGTYGTGFKAPSLFQLYSSYGSPDLKPERSRGWDAGIEQGLWGRRLVVGLTGFANRFDDMINFDYATSRYGNIEAAETRGLEATLGASPWDPLDVSASYTYTETEDETTGEELVRRPRHRGAVNVAYSVTPRLHSSLSVAYVGTREDQNFATGTPETLDDYVLVNVAASYDVTPHATVFARVDNLFDAEYEEVLGYGTPGIAGYGGVKLTF